MKEIRKHERIYEKSLIALAKQTHQAPITSIQSDIDYHKEEMKKLGYDVETAIKRPRELSEDEISEASPEEIDIMAKLKQTPLATPP